MELAIGYYKYELLKSVLPDGCKTLPQQHQAFSIVFRCMKRSASGDPQFCCHAQSSTQAWTE
jgi:hypothetical protein